MMHKLATSKVKYDCNLCIAEKRRNKRRGRDCMLGGKTNHITYKSKKTDKSYPVKNTKRMFKIIDGLCKRNNLYAPERFISSIGRGVCPKSIPLDSDILWWIELVDACSGGYSGIDLLQLPVAGGITDQPSLFFDIRRTIISIRETLRKESESS